MKFKFAQQTADQIAKLVTTIGKNSLKLSQLIQLACIQVIGHAFKSGDVTLGTKLVEAVGAHHRAAVTAFLEKYGPFAWSKDGKKFLHFKRKDVTFNEDYVESLPSWETAKKPAEIKSIYDMDVEAEKFLNRMAKLAADPNVTIKERQLLDTLIGVRNKYIADKYLAKTEGYVSEDKSVGPVQPEAEPVLETVKLAA